MGPPLDVNTVVSDASASLEAALDVFKGATAAAAPPEGAQGLIRSVADKLRGDAAKVGIMLGDGDVAVQEAAGLLGTLQQTGSALITYLHGLTYEAGPSLRDDLKHIATSVSTSCVALCNAVASTSGRKEAVTHAVAGVWDAVDQVKKQSLDNKSALFRRLATALRAGKDVLREMTELQPASDASTNGHPATNGQHDTNGGASSDDECDVVVVQQTRLEQGEPDAAPDAGGSEGGHEAEEEGEDSDDDGLAEFEAEALNSRETAVLTAVRKVLQAGVDTIQLLGRTLITAPSLSPRAVEGWESCRWHVSNLQRGLEDLGAAMYPPQDQEEVSSCVESVSISAECLLDELPEEGPQPDAAAVSALRARLDTATSRLTELLAQHQLQAEEEGEE